MFLQETYEVTDYIRYDDASTDKSSEYSYSNLNSFTYVTDHYEANRTLGTAESTYYSPIYVDETLPSDFEISIQFKSDSNYSDQVMLTVGTNHPITYSGTTECGILSTSQRKGLFVRNNGTGTFHTTNTGVAKDNWWTYYLKVESTSVTAKIIDSSNNEVYSQTQTISNIQSMKKWNFIVGAHSQTVQWKNLKIKAL